MTEETASVLRWLSKFVQTLEDGAIDRDEAVTILRELASLCDKVRSFLPKRWWKIVCAAVAVCLREGAEELARSVEQENEVNEK